MKVVTVTLNTAIDAVVSENDYTQTGLLKAERIPAGKGINVSRAFKSNRIPTIAYGLVGEADKELFDFQKDDFIEADFVFVPGKTRTNVTISNTKDGLEHHGRTEGFTAGEPELKQIYDRLVGTVEEGDWVVFSGSLPKGMPDNAYFKLIKLCNGMGAYTALDSSGRGLLNGIQAGPYVIKPNREELEEIAGRELARDEELLEIFRGISERHGVKIILTTLSEEGGILYDASGDRVLRLSAFDLREPLVSSVGSGDSALAGLLSGFLNYLSYEECLKEAMFFANANLYTPVPGELKWEAEA